MIHIPSIETKAEQNWQRYLIDSALALCGALFITGIIYIGQLYPRIPNISVLYLLIVVALASVRGQYAAILASVAAFLSFDFFIVPPIYTFTIARAEEWLALFVFLVVAIITGQLAAALRKRAEDASRSERETRILYELMRITNSEEEVEQQLQTIAQTVVSVFSSWGVRECTLLLPDEYGSLIARANAPHKDEQTILSSDEISTALQVMKQGRVIGIHDVSETPRSATNAVHRVIVQFNPTVPITRLYMLPLTTGNHTIGVLRVRVQNGLRAFPGAERPQESGAQATQANPRTTFFWTFIDQATAVNERARLRRESMHVEVLQRTDALRAALLSPPSHMICVHRFHPSRPLPVAFYKRMCNGMRKHNIALR
jgi:two-component system sensor histidine kinase KdpD